MKYKLKRYMRIDEGDEIFDTKEEAEEAMPGTFCNDEPGETWGEIEEVPETADEKGVAAAGAEKEEHEPKRV